MTSKPPALRLVAIALALAVGNASAQTTESFSQYIARATAATALSDSESVPVIQGGLTRAMRGVGFMATQNSNNVTITGGSISGVTIIGSTVPYTGVVDVPSATILGRTTAGTGAAEALTTLPTGLTIPSATLVAPALGTPVSGVMTNVTGLPLTTGVVGVLPSANGGTGVNNGSNTITLGGNVSTGGALTTGGSFTTGGALTIADLISQDTILYTNGARSVSGFAGCASGVVVYSAGGAPSCSTTLPNGLAMGTPASITLTNATGLPPSGLTGLGTGVATALGVNVGSAGAIVVNGGALGTPSSGTLTNATGLPISTGVSGLGTNVATALGTAASASGGIFRVGAILSASPANQTGTSSATLVMLGVGTVCVFTPSYSTRVRVTFDLNFANNTAGSGLVAALAYGTGTAPANGVALTGTVVTSQRLGITSTANESNPMSLNAIISGLSPGTAYWLDLQFRPGNGHTVVITNLNCMANEV